MLIRNLVYPVISIGWLIFVGCSDQKSSEYPEPQPIEISGYSTPETVDNPFERFLEKEVRKHDLPLVNNLEQDYTDDERDGVHTLRLISDEQAKSWFEFDIGGGYFPDTNVIGLRMSRDEAQMNDDYGDTISHELWHGVCDDFGEESIFNNQGYSGPTREEFEEYCLERVSGEEFDEVREMIERKKNVTKLKIYGPSWQSSYSYSLGNQLYRLSRDIIHHRAEREVLRYFLYEYLTDDDREYIDSIFMMIDEKGLFFIEEYDDCNRIASGLLDSETPPDESLLAETTERYQGLIDDVTRLDNMVDVIDDMSRLVGDIEYTKEIIDIFKNVTEPEWIESYRKKIDRLEKSILEYEDSLMMKIDKTRDDQEMSKKYMIEILEDKIYKNTQHLDMILGEPDEIMARIIESLYSLYYGKPTMSCFPMNEQDYEFLGRFRLNGKQVLRKGIERSMVRDEMVRDGYSPQEARDMLEHATSFEYNGKKYSWPDADFTIKGKIPLLGYGDTRGNVLRN